MAACCCRCVGCASMKSRLARKSICEPGVRSRAETRIVPWWFRRCHHATTPACSDRSFDRSWRRQVSARAKTTKRKLTETKVSRLRIQDAGFQRKRCPEPAAGHVGTEIVLRKENERLANVPRQLPRQVTVRGGDTFAEEQDPSHRKGAAAVGVLEGAKQDWPEPSWWRRGGGEGCGWEGERKPMAKG